MLQKQFYQTIVLINNEFQYVNNNYVQQYFLKPIFDNNHQDIQYQPLKQVKLKIKIPTLQMNSLTINNKIKDKYNQYKTHFILYSLFFFLYGATVNSLGPLFPYLSQLENVQQTSYSTLFVFRAAGYLIGCTISKMFQQIIYYHTYLKIGCFMLCLSSLLFTFLPSSMGFKCILMLLCGWGCAISNMFLHATIIWIYRFGHLDWYLIVAHGVYGLGGLFGPLLVLASGVNSYRIILCGLLVVFVALVKIKSPQIHENSKSSTSQQLLESNKNHEPEKVVNKIELNWLTGIMMCPIFMLAVGQQTIYGGWISSYAVMQSFCQKQHATIFSSLFWISITFFRFILASTPWRSFSKLLILFSLSFISCLVSLFLIHYLSPNLGLYTSAILFGLANSILYALGLSLPQDFDLILSTSQSSNFILSSAFGEGILAVLAGQLMEKSGPDSMFWLLGLMGLFGFFNVVYVVKKMKDQVQSDKKLQNQNGLLELKLVHNQSTDIS